MEDQNTISHGTSHNSALLIIFVVVMGILYFGFIKFEHPVPTSQQKKPAVKSNVTITHKGNVTTYTDTARKFTFQYPSTVKVNKSGIYKNNKLNIKHLLTTNHAGKLGTDFPPDQYPALATAITKGTKFQPVRTTANTKYLIRNDFETVKLGNNYFVKDFPATNTTCGCTEVQYVTIIGKYFVSFSMGKTATAEKTTQTASQTATNTFTSIETILSSLKPIN